MQVQEAELSELTSSLTDSQVESFSCADWLDFTGPPDFLNHFIDKCKNIRRISSNTFFNLLSHSLQLQSSSALLKR